MLFTVPSTGGFKENHTVLFFSGFKNPHKKIHETRKLESQKLKSEKPRVYAQKPQQKMSFKNSISVCIHAKLGACFFLAVPVLT
jgi:hypothetical protein